MNMNNGYEIQTIHLENNIFDDKTISATYIIHLRNNGRYNSLMKEINKYNTTKTVHILFNDGYKNAQKDLPAQNSTYDLIHAYSYIFRDALHRKYENILVLEDDFFFDQEIENPIHAHAMSDFIQSNKSDPAILLLGCIPYLLIPANVSCTFYRDCLSTGTHAAIYNKNVMEKLVKEEKSIDDWDIYTNFNCKRYVYYKPLCYQLFGETENSKEWGKFNIIWYILAQIIRRIFSLLNLHNSAQPGYQFFYIFAKLILLIILLLMLILILPSFVKFKL